VCVYVCARSLINNEYANDYGDDDDDDDVNDEKKISIIEFLFYSKKKVN